MIWYSIPPALSRLLFFGLLLTTAAQVIALLEAGELLRDKGALRSFRLFYGLLAVVSALLVLEAITALASLEGGLYIDLQGLPRYAAILPGLCYLCTSRQRTKIPGQLQPQALTALMPLLYLPPGRLPGPWPLALTVFAAAWMMGDAAAALLSFWDYSRKEITRGALAQVIRRISLGICVANRRGWVVEANPAFARACARLGIAPFEHTGELETALAALHNDGRLKVKALEKGRFLHRGSCVYFLQRSTFRAGGSTLTQLSLSDVTDIARAGAALEQENEALTRNNSKLESAIAAICLEERVRERERLCRAAHDHWSQQMAVAGLLIDSCSAPGEGSRGSSDAAVAEILKALEEPAAAQRRPAAHNNLAHTLRELEEMYRRLGVEINVAGAATFSSGEEEALGAVLREALANAVRHAYSRQIAVTFFSGKPGKGMVIRNDCLDHSGESAEGRGLHDMKTRLRQAGGLLYYHKDKKFTLEAIFPKITTEGGSTAVESYPDRGSEPAQQHPGPGAGAKPGDRDRCNFR